MNKIFKLGFCVTVFLFFVIMLGGCSLDSKTNGLKEISVESDSIPAREPASSINMTAEKCYKMDDFSSITIGESTAKDVYVIAPIDYMVTTSYGGFCDFQKQNGGSIRIKFYGPDLIVLSIEEIELEEPPVFWPYPGRS